jgi:hypothetical protein
MIQRPFHFELHDMLTQFVAVFDDVVIGRFNRDRTELNKINVRYVYAPKQRVLYDIVNLAKTITIPAVALTISNIQRDTSRVFNKVQGFYYSGGKSKASAHLRMPVPVNVTVNMSIIARYQTDMDQIISNFVPYTNPYIVISWPVPKEFNLPQLQEIRSEVQWNGDINLQYPTDLKGSDKARILADTSFTIKGWLFKSTDDILSNNVYYLKTNFNAENIITDYESLSGDTYSWPLSTGLITETEQFELSGGP